MNQRKESKRVTVFDTHYALTTGILQLEVEESEDTNGVYYWDSHGTGRVLNKHDAFLTREEAVIRANEVKDRKIKNLKKQIEKLEYLTF